MAKRAALPTPKIVTDDRMPVGAVALVSGDSVAAYVAGEVHTFRLSSLTRADCAFPRCQLSLGHPPTHCCGSQSRPGVYLMVDDDGKILREL